MIDRQRLVNVASIIQAATDGLNMKWFLAFGSLLHWVRDKELSLNEDIDIGVMGDPDAAILALSTYFSPAHIIREDHNGQPLCASFRHDHSGFILDCFFWRKKDGYYYHAYDQNMSMPANGILNEYTFKGVPCDCFDVSKPVIEKYQKDLRYGRDMTDHGTWKKVVPNIQEEGIQLCLPWSYGRCLDIWYPDWATTRSQFGVSLSEHSFTVKSCKDIVWEK